MTNCNLSEFVFPMVCGRRVEVDFSGGNVTSDGGILLQNLADKRIRLLSRAARVLPDPRRQKSIDHSQLEMLRQRVYGIGQGYEDLNDHTDLRQDMAFQTGVGRDELLASASTLCRFENRSDRQTALSLSGLMVEVFIESFQSPPEKLVLDFDATEDPVHGDQVGRFYHGYYDCYCFLPLYVFCGQQLLVSYLRPSNIDGSKHAWAILSLLVKRFREQWPQVRIVFRGDCDFCRPRMLAWCDHHDVKFITGLARNSRLEKICSRTVRKAQKQYRRTGRQAKLFVDIWYATKKTWKKRRRVIVKAEHNAKGPNTRFVVTNLEGQARELYEKVYCARGDMENRIKEQKLPGLFADRTSCHEWWPNQFRVLLSSMGYILFETIRRLGLQGTELAKAQCSTIRLKLLKIGGIIVRNTRRIRFQLAVGCPYKNLFFLVANRLVSSG